MRRSFIFARAVSVALVGLTLTAHAQVDRPQDAGQVQPSRPSSNVARQASEALLDLSRKLRSVELETSRIREGEEDRLADLVAEKAAVERSVQALNAQVEKVEKELALRKERLAREEKELALHQQELRALLDPLRQFLDRAESHIERGIPWRVEERRLPLAEARALLGASDPKPVELFEMVARFQQQEEALARSIEHGVVELDMDGERRGIAAFHLGLLAVVFSNADGTIAGFVQPGQKVEEGLLTAAAGGAKDRGYAAAIDILRRRLTPRVVDLYVPELVVGSEEGK